MPNLQRPGNLWQQIIHTQNFNRYTPYFRLSVTRSIAIQHEMFMPPLIQRME
jgi:hypothetical protein